jgi:hypothetical protein
MINEYTALRQNELKFLRELPPRDWARTGRHNIFGVRTVQWWVERMLEYAMIQLHELQAS